MMRWLRRELESQTGRSDREREQCGAIALAGQALVGIEISGWG